MRAPDFWARDGLLPLLLSPLACLYALGGWLRFSFTQGYHAEVPVICVGNLVAGGAGKTPIALDIIQRLQSAGLRVHALTRGYGGSERGPVRVLPGHTAAEVGDEALLLAEQTDTWVSADRPSGARAASAAGAQIIVMDDGFQNPSLHKDFSLLVVDAAFGLGNGRVMPAGPLREPAGRGLARAGALVVLGPENTQDWENTALARRLTTKDTHPLLAAGLTAKGGQANLTDRKVLAFAGIGRPEKFYATLRELSLEIVETRDFPDHHPYTDGEIEELLQRAATLDAVAITTEKDAVRLSPQYRSRVTTLPIEVVWRDPAAIEGLLGPLVQRCSTSG